MRLLHKSILPLYLYLIDLVTKRGRLDALRDATFPRAVLDVEVFVLLEDAIEALGRSLDEDVVVQGEVRGNVGLLKEGVGVLIKEVGEVLLDQ